MGTLPATSTNALNQTTTTGYTTTSAGGFGQWPTSVTDPNHQTTSASYDALGRVTDTKTTLTSSGATLFEETPSYDAVGTVVSVNTTLPQGTDSQSFTYDELNRLTSAGTPFSNGLTTARYSVTYTYDTLDRLTSGPIPGVSGSNSYSYNDSYHLDAATAIQSPQGTAYWTAKYDAAGNLICRSRDPNSRCDTALASAQFTYDAEGRLAHWQNKASSPTSTDDDLYDGEGQRVLQQAVVSGTTTTTTYVGNLEEVAVSGSTTTTTTSYYLGGKRLAVSVNGTISYLASDLVNSGEVALNTTGGATASILYGPYGTVRYSSGTMPGTEGFTGQHDDTATIGLDYYGARYYDPVSGQFASADTDAAGG